MKEKSRFPLFRRRDLLIFLFALLLAAAGFFQWVPRADGLVAVIEQNGKEVCRVELSRITKPETVVLEGEYEVEILLEPGQVSILRSGCPDQICVNTGVLTRPGQSAVCLPARIAVRVVGEKEGSTDGMTG